MKIFPARPQDVEALVALEEQCFPDPWPAEIIARLRERFTVAVEDEQIVGSIAFSSVVDEGNIDDIAVAPDHRRQGIADALIQDAVERARAQGLAMIYLEVRASNEAAICLYQKHGFQAVGRRRDYYEIPREDAILMTLVI